MYASEPYRNAVALQRLLIDTANAVDSKPLERASCARAFVELEEMKRKIAMRPLPKPVDVSKLGKGKRKAQSGPAYQEPIESSGPGQAPALPKPTTTAGGTP